MSWPRRFLPHALFAVLVCIFLWRAIFTGVALLSGDYLAQMSPWNTVSKPSNPPPQWNPLQWDAIAQYYPWRVFYARSMRAGFIPLWNPHQFCGTPFLANGQSGVLYPLNLLFLIVDPITGFTVLAALHMFLTASFMYLLLREVGRKELGAIVGGVTFAFSAFAVLWLELPTFVQAATWLPLALLLIHRAVERASAFYGMLSGGVIALSFLAGHFHIAFYVLLGAALWWLWKLVAVWQSEGKRAVLNRVVIPAAACFAVFGLIAAAQVLPTQELAANSHRVREVTAEGYQRFISNAVKPYRLVTAFAPDFFGNPSKSNYYLIGQGLDGNFYGSAADYMEYGMYAGILPLMLALFAFGLLRKVRHAGFFALLSVFALLSATGTPLNYLFYHLIPGFSALGGPNRILLLYLFGVAALAGFGADYLAEATGGQRRRALLATAGAAVVVLIVFAVTWRMGIHVVGEMIGLTVYDEGVAILAGLVFGVIFVISATMLIAQSLGPRDSRLFSAIGVLIIVADLFAFGINYNPTCDRSRVYPQTKLTTELKRLTRNGERIAPINPTWSLFTTPDAILPPNAAMVYGLYDMQGYDSLYTRAYKDLSSKIQGIDSSPPENGNIALVRRFAPDIGRLARYVVTSADLGEQAELLRTLDDVRVYEIRGPRKRRPEPRCEPFSFRLGLFLSLVGIGAISTAATYRILADRQVRR